MVKAGVFDFAVFSNSAALVVELANVVLALADPLMKVLGLANLFGWTIRAWNPINDTLRSLFRRGAGDILVVA